MSLVPVPWSPLWGPVPRARGRNQGTVRQGTMVPNELRGPTVP